MGHPGEAYVHKHTHLKGASFPASVKEGLQRKTWEIRVTEKQEERGRKGDT